VTIDEVCTAYYGYVYGCCTSYRNADDLTQTVFLKICKAWSKECESWDDTHLKRWLAHIAKNTCIDALRYQSYRNHEELGEECIAPGDVENDVERHVLIATCLATLTTEQRRILLSTAQGYGYRECVPDVGKTMAFRRIKQARKAFLQEWEKAA